MASRTFTALFSITALALSAGCDGIGEISSTKMTILDAAEVYVANQEAFASIRSAYPGPFHGFARAPARNPADQTREEDVFLKGLRQQFPVEYIDFFPLADTGKDEIDVVLTRYGANARWTLVSLVYSEVPLPQPPDEQTDLAVFGECEPQVLGWLEFQSKKGRAAAFCRINQYWYAYQRIE